MADDDRRDDGPSLELPSFSLRRRRRGRSSSTEDHAEEGVEAPPSRAPEEDANQEAEVTRPLPAPRGPSDEVPATVAPPPPPPPPVVPATTGPVPAGPEGDETRPLLADAQNAPETVDEPPAAPRRSRRARRAPAVPRIGGAAAAVLAGLLVGAVVVGLTWASLNGCELVRGTSSCGGGPGLLLLVGIFVVAVLLGAGLLRVLRVGSAGATSFLAVGLLAVVVLLVPLDEVERWWSALVVPVVTAVTFGLARWLTAAFVEPGGR